MKRTWITGLGTSLVAAALVAGCTGGAGAAGTATPAATEATAVPTPAVFTGTQECRDDPTPPVTAPGGDVGYGLCERTMADPRLSGTMHLISYVGGTDDATALWAEGTLENAEGSWGCKQFGVGSRKNQVGGLDEVCVGRGAYAGLTAYVRLVTADQLSTFGLLAWIEGTAARQ
jgi:hypothetical protein